MMYFNTVSFACKNAASLDFFFVVSIEKKNLQNCN